MSKVPKNTIYLSRGRQMQSPKKDNVNVRSETGDADPSVAVKSETEKMKSLFEDYTALLRIAEEKEKKIGELKAQHEAELIGLSVEVEQLKMEHQAEVKRLNIELQIVRKVNVNLQAENAQLQGHVLEATKAKAKFQQIQEEKDKAWNEVRALKEEVEQLEKSHKVALAAGRGDLLRLEAEKSAAEKKIRQLEAEGSPAPRQEVKEEIGSGPGKHVSRIMQLQKQTSFLQGELHATKAELEKEEDRCKHLQELLDKALQDYDDLCFKHENLREFSEKDQQRLRNLEKSNKDLEHDYGAIDGAIRFLVQEVAAYFGQYAYLERIMAIDIFNRYFPDLVFIIPKSVLDPARAQSLYFAYRKSYIIAASMGALPFRKRSQCQPQ